MPLQHPFGQDVASHTHEPFTQCRPGTHLVPEPHRHCPPVQLSARTGSQAAHVWPFVPQLDTVGGETQIVPEQHPLGHDVGSHTHAPPAQRCPGAHDAPEPHMHCPPVQLSASEGSQATHVCPPVPQLVGVGGETHVVLEQQPLGHEVASHTHDPPTQRCPEAHAAAVPHEHWPPAQPSARAGSQAAHAWPLVPQLDTVGGETQIVPEQHPLGHEVGSHTHAPLAQRCPGAHDAPEPHMHCPPVQLSASEGSQATHAFPPTPQLAGVGGEMQVVPEQQPLGHEAASHTHDPPTQRCPEPHAAPEPHRHCPPTQLSASAPQADAQQLDASQSPLSHWLP